MMRTLGHAGVLLLLSTMAGCSAGARTSGISATTSGGEESATAEHRVASAAVAVDDPSWSLVIHVINSGQGDCAIVQCPNGANIVVDCGSSSWGNTDLEAVIAEVNGVLGGDDVDVLVLTHPDRDHYRLIPDVLAGRVIERVLYSGDLADYDQADIATFLARVPEHERHGFDAAHHDDDPSELIDCGPQVDVHILAAGVRPQGAHARRASWISNSGSIVLRFGVPGASRALAILTGDATFYTEQAIAAHYATREGFLRADLLRLGHHGTSVTSSSEEWIDTVDPRAAFTSAGHYGGNLRHPRCSVTERVLDQGSLGSVGRHDAECGTEETSSGPCPSGEQWCAFQTSFALYNTHSTGSMVFRFEDGWLQRPVTR